MARQGQTRREAGAQSHGPPGGSRATERRRSGSRTSSEGHSGNPVHSGLHVARIGETSVFSLPQLRPGPRTGAGSWRSGLERVFRANARSIMRHRREGTHVSRWPEAVQPGAARRPSDVLVPSVRPSRRRAGRGTGPRELDVDGGRNPRRAWGSARGRVARRMGTRPPRRGRSAVRGHVGTWSTDVPRRRVALAEYVGTHSCGAHPGGRRSRIFVCAVGAFTAA